MTCNGNWQRFVLNLSRWNNETPEFDNSRVTVFRFFSAHPPSSARFQLSVDDIILDKAPTSIAYIFKGRVMPQDTLVFKFDAIIPAAVPLPTQPASPGWISTIVIFTTTLSVPAVICVIRMKRGKTSVFPTDNSL